MSVQITEIGKRKIIEGMLTMPDSPFFMEGGEMRARYDDIRLVKTDDGRLSVELAYLGKSVLTMAFEMPVGIKKLSILGQGSMGVTVDVNGH